MAAEPDVDPIVVANWVTGELVAASREAGFEHPAETKAGAAGVGAVARMVDGKEISRGSGRELLAELVANGGDPAEVSERLGLTSDDGDDLAAIVAAAIEAQPDAAAKVKAGEGKAIGAIIGVVMRETKGRADGGEATRLIREQLGL